MNTISDQAKAQIECVLQPGEWAVDATMGNGWDTLFLAQTVGERGRVFAFDVQEAALEKTRRRLDEAGVLARCQLLLQSHQEIAQTVSGELGAVMFNLGYLPYADRSVITQEESTLAALRGAASLVRVGGIMTVICYRGHPGGSEEADAVWRWAQEMGGREFEYQGPSEIPATEQPFLLSLQKKR